MKETHEIIRIGKSGPGGDFINFQIRFLQQPPCFLQLPFPEIDCGSFVEQPVPFPQKRTVRHSVFLSNLFHIRVFRKMQVQIRGDRIDCRRIPVSGGLQVQACAQLYLLHQTHAAGVNPVGRAGLTDRLAMLKNLMDHSRQVKIITERNQHPVRTPEKFKHRQNTVRVGEKHLFHRAAVQRRITGSGTGEDKRGNRAFKALPVDPVSGFPFRRRQNDSEIHRLPILEIPPGIEILFVVCNVRDRGKEFPGPVDSVHDQ